MALLVHVRLSSLDKDNDAASSLSSSASPSRSPSLPLVSQTVRRAAVLGAPRVAAQLSSSTDNEEGEILDGTTDYGEEDEVLEEVSNGFFRVAIRCKWKISQDLGGGEGLPEWNRSKNWKELKFGHSGGGQSARDSRYWDRDDRQRDEDYSEDEKEKILGAGGNASDAGGSSNEKGVTSDPGVEEKGLTLQTSGGDEEGAEVAEGGKGGTLYNERGRKELEQYEVAAMGTVGTGMREVDLDDEYDDGIDAQDDFDDAQLHSSDGGRKLGDVGAEAVNDVVPEPFFI